MQAAGMGCAGLVVDQELAPEPPRFSSDHQLDLLSSVGVKVLRQSVCRQKQPSYSPLRGPEARAVWRWVDACLTVAAVAQVGPDDVLLRETEDPEPSSPHCGVDDDARVHHHPRALVETHSAKWRRNQELQ